MDLRYPFCLDTLRKQKYMAPQPSRTTRHTFYVLAGFNESVNFGTAKAVEPKPSERGTFRCPVIGGGVHYRHRPESYDTDYQKRSNEKLCSW